MTLNVGRSSRVEKLQSLLVAPPGEEMPQSFRGVRRQLFLQLHHPSQRHADLPGIPRRTRRNERTEGFP